MEKDVLFENITALKRNTKIARALEIFSISQEIIENSIKATTPQGKVMINGKYSNFVDEKEYCANISTTTR